MNKEYLKYIDKGFKLSIGEGTITSIYGSKNDEIIEVLEGVRFIDNLSINGTLINKKNLNYLRSEISFASINFIDIFNSETVYDELAFPLESIAMDKKNMKIRVDSVIERFNLKEDKNSPLVNLDLTAKAKVQIASALISESKIVVLDNILSLLDKSDLLIVSEVINNFVKEGHIVINFTNNIEEALLGNIVVVNNKDKVLIEGETISVLNEEKIMKRLGYSLPFKVLLNKYLKDYELINNYILDYKELGGVLWK